MKYILKCLRCGNADFDMVTSTGTTEGEYCIYQCCHCGAIAEHTDTDTTALEPEET